MTTAFFIVMPALVRSPHNVDARSHVPLRVRQLPGMAPLQGPVHSALSHPPMK